MSLVGWVGRCVIMLAKHAASAMALSPARPAYVVSYFTDTIEHREYD